MVRPFCCASCRKAARCPRSAVREMPILSGFFRYFGQRTGPHNGVQTDIVCKQDFPACFKINDGRQIGLVQAKKVEESAVLPERVGVVFVIAGSFLLPINSPMPVLIFALSAARRCTYISLSNISVVFLQR